MKPSSRWHLKSSNTILLLRCLMILVLLGRSFQLSELQMVNSRASHKLFCTPSDVPPAGCPNLVRFPGASSAAMDPFRG